MANKEDVEELIELTFDRGYQTGVKHGIPHGVMQERKRIIKILQSCGTMAQVKETIYDLMDDPHTL